MQWFLEMQASNQLDLDPSYQRRSVWNDDYRRYYVDTILRDYPSPTIYLQVETRPGFPTIYHVIDGKQRLEALIGFASNEFHLGNYQADDGFPDAYWDDLSTELKERFVEYSLSVENISGASDNELRDAFNRLNRNVAKLNRAELRKARFEGRFITLSQALTEDPFWLDTGVTAPARVRRMLDVEFISELLLLTKHGIQDGGSDELDAYYLKYDEEIPGEDELERDFREIVTYLTSMPLNWRGTRWRNLADLYSLWAAVDELRRVGELPPPDEAAARLTIFSERVNAAASEDERRYGDAVRQGSNKAANRETRAYYLKNVLLTGSPSASPA